MNKEATKTYQQLIHEFSNAPRDNSEEFIKRYEEMLDIFLNLDEVYTIASKEFTPEAVKNNRALPLCALNHKKLPCIWLFTERELAQRFVKHFGLIKEDVEYIISLKGEDIIRTIKHAIFNGVYQFAIDEGAAAMGVVPYDLLNVYLRSKGEEEFLARKQYDIMIFFNMMKYHKKLVYAIETDEKAKNGTGILAEDRQGVINIFDKKEDADVHKYDIGYGRKDSRPLNIIQLRDAVNAAVENNIGMMRFEIQERIVEVKTVKVQYVLNQMTKMFK